MIIRLAGNDITLEKLGNKGKNLLLMKQNGFNVPDGFVLDSDIFDETMESSGLKDKIDEIIGTLTKDPRLDTIFLPDGNGMAVTVYHRPEDK